MPKKASPDTAVRKVFIVEDHPVFRQGLMQMLAAESDLKVIGFSGDAAGARRDIVKAQPDLVLVDIGLPGKSGLELIKEIRATNPKVKLLVVSMHDQALYADRVLRAGGAGYVMKQEAPEEIIHAIRDVLAGRIYVRPEVLAEVKKRPARRTVTPNVKLVDLTDDDLVMLELLGQVKGKPEIARQLNVGIAAVAARCTRIQKKLKLKTANALVRFAVGWVEEAG